MIKMISFASEGTLSLQNLWASCSPPPSQPPLCSAPAADSAVTAVAAYLRRRSEVHEDVGGGHAGLEQGLLGLLHHGVHPAHQHPRPLRRAQPVLQPCGVESGRCETRARDATCRATRQGAERRPAERRAERGATAMRRAARRSSERVGPRGREQSVAAERRAARRGITRLKALVRDASGARGRRAAGRE